MEKWIMEVAMFIFHFPKEQTPDPTLPFTLRHPQVLEIFNAAQSLFDISRLIVKVGRKPDKILSR